MTGAVWPARLDGPDPYGDAPQDMSLGFDDYVRAGGALAQEAYEAHATRLLELLSSLEAGPWPASGQDELDHLLRILQISRHLTVDRRTPPEPAPFVPPDADLARIAADLCPTAGMEAADRVLGPLVDELNARAVPAHAAALRVALAAACFFPPDGEVQTPFEQWCRRKPLPSPSERAAVRAIQRAPWTAWHLVRQADDGRWEIEDHVGLGARFLPVGPVRLVGAAAPFRPPRDGDTLVARVVEGPAGWETRTPLVIPGGPPATRIQSWVRLELIRARLQRRTLTVEALLRTRGYVLARRLCEWAWHYGDDDPYSIPELYDLEYRDHREDMAFYISQARRQGGPVLELGCGTGRLSLALARSGVSVHGVDASQAMLDALARKVAQQPELIQGRITWEQGDFRALDLPAVHPLVIIPFNALHHCRSPEELQQLLAGAARAVRPGGRLTFDCYLPDLELYDRDPDQRFEERIFKDPRTGGRLRSWEQGWWEAETHIHHVVYVYEHEDGRQERTHLQLRMFSLEEIREAIARAGLRILREASDFDGRPLTDDALKYVAVTVRPG